MALSEEVVEDYRRSLRDLNVNSKPLINMMTMLAEDHEPHANEIVAVIEEHILKCRPEKKLPALYLMDSIMKNLEKSSYRSLFCRNIVQVFTSVFEQVDEKTRASMFKLRQTWSAILPNQKLYMIDVKIHKMLDPAWPITAKPDKTNMHVNPKFLHSSESERSSPEVQEPIDEDPESQEALMRQQLIAKQQELLRLQQARLELELAEAEEKFKRTKEEQKKRQTTPGAKALDLPLPSEQDRMPLLPEPVAQTRDPRARPADPRLRDPRLQKPDSTSSTYSAMTASKAVSDVTKSKSPVDVNPPFSAMSTSAVSSSWTEVQFTGQGYGSFPAQGPYSIPSSYPDQSADMYSSPGYTGGHWPHPGADSPSENVFRGEVYEDITAKFSDDNDSDSSRSSFLDQRIDLSQQRSAVNIRDPRNRTATKPNNDPRLKHSRQSVKSDEKQRHSNTKEDLHTKNIPQQHPRSVDQRLQRSPHSDFSSLRRGGSSVLYTSHTGDSDLRKKSDKTKIRDGVPSPQKSIQGSKARSISKERETSARSTSKDRDQVSVRSTSKERDSHGMRSLSNERDFIVGRSVSAERENKSSGIKEPKVEQTSVMKQKDVRKESAGRFKSEGDKARGDFKSSGKTNDMKVDKQRTNKDSDVSQKSPKSPKQISSKTNQNRSDITREKKIFSKTDARSGSKKVEDNKTGSKIRKSETQSPSEKADSKVSSPMKRGKEKAKVDMSEDKYGRKSGDRSIQSVGAGSKQGKRVMGGDGEKRTREKDPETVRARKKQRIEARLEKMDEFPEALMEVNSENEEQSEKVDEDISDLFGVEDEDFRSVQQQLPLKSPSSKGWDQYKEGKDEYAYDRELKKQRENTGVPPRGHRMEEEPQDIDYRVGPPPRLQSQMSTASDVEIPNDLSVEHHSDILLKAHKRLQEGHITNEDYQSVMKQLGQLVQLHQLQEQTRRVSTEGVQQTEQPPINPSALKSPPHILGTVESAPEPVSTEEEVEVRSPSQPLGHFRIPKKSQSDRNIRQDEDQKREHDNMYPPEIDDRSRDFDQRQPPLDVRHGPADEHHPSEGHRPHPAEWRSPREERIIPEEDWHGHRKRDGPLIDQLPPPDMIQRGPPGRPDRMPPVGAPDRGPDVPGPPRRRTLLPDPEIEPIPIERRGPLGRFDDRHPDRRPPFDDRQGHNEFEPEPYIRPDEPHIKRERDPPAGGDWRDFHDNRRPDDRHDRHFRGRGSWPDREPFPKREPFEDGPDSRFRDDMPVDLDDPRGPIHPDDPRGLIRPDDPRGPIRSDDPRGPIRSDDPRGPIQPDDPRGPIRPDGPRGPYRRGPGDRRGPHDSWRDQKHGRGDIPHDNWDEDRPGNWENVPREDRFRGPPNEPRDLPGRRDDKRGPPDGPRLPHGDRRDERKMPGENIGPGPHAPYGDQGPQENDFDEGRRENRKRPRSPQREPFRRLHRDQFDDEGEPPSKLDSRTGLPPWNVVKNEPVEDEEFGNNRSGPKFRERGRGRHMEQGPGPDDRRFPPRHRGPPGSESNGPPFDGPPGRKGNRGNHFETYIDKFGDPRFRCFSEMGPQVSEEVVIGRKNFEVKLGAPPRRIRWSKTAYIVVHADPVKRGVVIDGNLVYKFGERVKEIMLHGRMQKIFYHGRPLNIWFDNQLFEIRVDSPPNSININGKEHKIQIDGRDMMILIDKNEKGTYGGPPRFVFIGDERIEMRFEPLPKTIQIDGNFCELNLNTTVQPPSVLINGIWHGIRFNGPPRDICIDGRMYQIFTDHAVKLRVGSRFHYVALGGPCHELIIDGKCFEVKFNEPPKEICVGNSVMMVKLPGQPPEVKILPPIGPPGPGGPPNMPMGGPGPMGPMRPPGPPQSSIGGPMSQPPMSMPGPGVNIRPGMGIPPSTVPGSVPMPTPGMPQLPGMGPPASIPGTVVSQPPGMPSVLSTLFGGAGKPGPINPVGPPMPPPVIDINSLLDKLVTSGIIKKEADTKPDDSEVSTSSDTKQEPQSEFALKKKPVVKEVFEDVPDMTDFDPVAMKSLPVGAIQRLYAGIQCMSCGQRFDVEDSHKSEIYKNHLDWHFRQNKKDKDDMKVARCRKWFYGTDDWIQYEDVMEEEETGKSNFFEQQAPQSPEKPQLSLVTAPDGSSIIRCPEATGNDSDDMCNICHEPFEQYWDEELEEWHLRDAIKVNNKTYHPICYEDYTEVSEGTPSPSILDTTAPSFTPRKSMAYEESSQDGHHTSFEDERKIISAPEIKSEPGVEVKTEPSSDNSEAETKVKSEKDVEVKTETQVKVEPKDEPDSYPDSRVKQESDTVVKTEADSVVKPEPVDMVIKSEASDSDQLVKSQGSHSSSVTNEPVKTEPIDTDTSKTSSRGSEPNSDLVEVKKEPESPSPAVEPASSSVSTDNVQSVDDTSSVIPDSTADIKEEPMDTHSAGSTLGFFSYPGQKGSIPGLDVSFLTEEESEEKYEPMETNNAANSDVVPECSEKDSPEKYVPEVVSQSPESSQVDTPEEYVPSAIGQAHIEESSVDKSEESEPLESVQSTGKTEEVGPVIESVPIQTLSSVRSSTPELLEPSFDHLVPPEQSSSSQLQLSPTSFSRLRQVNLSIKQEPVTISSDVMEIGSNASTPTRDELPSPEDSLL